MGRESESPLPSHIFDSTRLTSVFGNFYFLYFFLPFARWRRSVAGHPHLPLPSGDTRGGHGKLKGKVDGVRRRSENGWLRASTYRMDDAMISLRLLISHHVVVGVLWLALAFSFPLLPRPTVHVRWFLAITVLCVPGAGRSGDRGASEERRGQLWVREPFRGADKTTSSRRPLSESQRSARIDAGGSIQ